MQLKWDVIAVDGPDINTSPWEFPISLAQAKTHLRIDSDLTDDDDYVENSIVAAFEDLNGTTGWLGRALAQQTFTLVLNRFPYGRRINLPYPPLLTVQTVQYLSSLTDSPDYLAVDPDDYRVVSDVEPGYIELRESRAWPSHQCADDAVRITFTAGYTSVPELIKKAMLLKISDLYHNRETVVVGTIVAPLPQVAGMLNNFRIRYNPEPVR